MRPRLHKIPKNRGQAMITAVMLLLAGSLIIVGSVSSPVLKDIRITRSLEESKQSFSMSEGAVEDLVYRIKNGYTFSTIENTSLNGVMATATTIAILDQREVVALGDKDNIKRLTRVVMSQSTGASFNYGLQAGDGGIHMKNTSSVVGNIYSNGPITGANSNITYGDIVSAGPTGLIDGVHATSSAFAHTINNSDIDLDAYYQVISGTTVGGTSFPGSPDQMTSTMPIDDSLVSDWEIAAQAGGIISSPCPYLINSDVVIGPVKIECDLNISGTPTVTLNGVVWVTGNILIGNSSVIRINPALGGKSVPIIADNPADRLLSSKVKITNSSSFLGSGTEGSYILVLSQNNSAENGGNEKAIEVNNTANGDLLIYAGHGVIDLQNSISLKEVTGYKINLNNSAKIIYETGLASLLFTSGPGGGYVIESWLEI